MAMLPMAAARPPNGPAPNAMYNRMHPHASPMVNGNMGPNGTYGSSGCGGGGPAPGTHASPTPYQQRYPNAMAGHTNGGGGVCPGAMTSGMTVKRGGGGGGPLPQLNAHGGNAAVSGNNGGMAAANPRMGMMPTPPTGGIPMGQQYGSGGGVYPQQHQQQYGLPMPQLQQVVPSPPVSGAGRPAAPRHSNNYPTAAYGSAAAAVGGGQQTSAAGSTLSVHSTSLNNTSGNRSKSNSVTNSGNIGLLLDPRAVGVPPPVARGPQPTNPEPTRLPSGQKIRTQRATVNTSINHNSSNPQQRQQQQQQQQRALMPRMNRQASRFASVRQLPGAVVTEMNTSDDDDDDSGYGGGGGGGGYALGMIGVSPDKAGKREGGNNKGRGESAGDRKKREAAEQKTRGATKNGPPPGGCKRREGGGGGGGGPRGERNIKVTVGNDDTWMNGRTHTIWVDSPMQSARGDGPYRRRPGDAKNRRQGGSNDGDSEGSSNRGGKRTFADKLRALFNS